MSEKTTYDPQLDGFDHLNVYSNARTPLGRFASNFASSPLRTEHGSFLSIEGYWHWLKTGSPERDELRDLSGKQALDRGRELRKISSVECPDFENKIRRAITIKFFDNQQMLQALQQNDLPLTHYYVIKGHVVQPEGYEWITAHLTAIGKKYAQ